jgi:hypothetical protein
MDTFQIKSSLDPIKMTRSFPDKGDVDSSMPVMVLGAIAYRLHICKPW